MSVGDEDHARLEHMLGASLKAMEYAGIDQAEFIASDFAQSAVLHRLLVLGEAAKAVSRETREELPDLPWREMMRMRDVLIHHYFGVRLDIVWGVVRDELPDVVARLEGVLATPPR